MQEFKLHYVLYLQMTIIVIKIIIYGQCNKKLQKIIEILSIVKVLDLDLH